MPNSTPNYRRWCYKVGVLSRLLWRNPFDRSASVLYAIEQSRLPLTPPDDDVERLSLADAHPSETFLQSGYSMAFLSHTAKDERVFRARVRSAVEPFFAQTFLLNIGMSTRSPDIVDAYRRRILSALNGLLYRTKRLARSESPRRSPPHGAPWRLRSQLQSSLAPAIRCRNSGSPR